MAALELINTTLFNDANLVSYWKFTGNSNDSKASNNGADTGMAYVNSPAQFGTAANFSTTGYITLSGTTGFPVGSTARTLMGWVYLSGTGQQTTLLTYGAAGVAQVSKFSLQSPNKLWFQDYGVNATAGGNTSLSISTWYNIAITIDASANINYYVNGTNDGTATILGFNTVAGISYFGTQDSAFTQSSYNGYLDDVALFSRVLTSTEINNHWLGNDALATGFVSYRNLLGVGF